MTLSNIITRLFTPVLAYNKVTRTNYIINEGEEISEPQMEEVEYAVRQKLAGSLPDEARAALEFSIGFMEG